MIYYVEDDENIRDLAIFALKKAGIEAKGFVDAPSFLLACEEALPDAALLDIMLPGMDGLELLGHIRSDPRLARLPVMILSAKGTEFDKASGLDSGADDYLAKPFGMMEFVSRVNALLRRSFMEPFGTSASSLVFGVLSIDVDAHRVVCAGETIELTVKEFDLLVTLATNAEKVLTRNALLNSVWGMSFPAGTRTVDVHIQTLRQKLASVSAQVASCIETVRGVGYVFRAGRLEP